MNYLIIGNGVASVAAIEGIRQHDPDGPITVVSREPVKTYGRPLISYLLAGKIKPAALWYRPDSFYKKNKVVQELGVRIVSINPVTKKAYAEGDREFAYDKCLIATGGAPYIPEIKGLEGPGVHCFTTLAHAEELLAALKGVERCTVVGAGLIALKAAEGLAARGVKVTLMVRSRIMRAYFDETAGDMLVDHLREQGVEFALGAAPRAIERDETGKIVAVTTNQGRIETDLVVLAAGVRPETGLAESAGAKCATGVLVDEFLRTSVADIYAAGDVTEAVDLITGQRRVIPIWPNAYHQGLYAGQNMAGGELRYPGTLSMNSIAYFGLPTQSVGLVNPPQGDTRYQSFAKQDKRAKRYRKLVFEGDRLVGYVLVGDIEPSGVYTTFVQYGFPVDEELRKRLVAGEAGVLSWPHKFFDQSFSPKMYEAAPARTR
ncbi:MAG: NAD(P)/FAD-dependent oxidoreductase [Desulfovibrionaceae bacterium]